MYRRMCSILEQLSTPKNKHLIDSMLALFCERIEPFPAHRDFVSGPTKNKTRTTQGRSRVNVLLQGGPI